ncbi:MAG: DUF5320 domain-containing protein [Bacteroidales bacterium]
MPGFDRTGPMGQGPMTGRRMGRCTNFGANQKKQDTTTNQNQDSLDTIQGRGFGLGRGRAGRGFGLGRQNRFRGGF